MNTASHLEKTFEDKIEQHLVSNGWIKGNPGEYSKETGFDTSELKHFILATQAEKWARLESLNASSDVAWRKFIERLSNEISSRGLVDVLRKGIKDTGVHFDLAYFAPANGLSAELKVLYEQNRLTVTRQVRMSELNPLDSIDIVLFLNGIPLATIELKSQTAGQSVQDAMHQYRRDRDPMDLLFKERALVHFALDEDEVFLTTRLLRASTEFRPFNLGTNGPGNDGGAGNPLNPHGERTSYLWESVLQKDNWLKLFGQFVHISHVVDEASGKKTGEKRTIFPRYHQWHAVESAAKAIQLEGPKNHRLFQHSAGSGKSNTISWLAYTLSTLHSPDAVSIGERLKADGFAPNEPIFNKVIIVTDRRVLDKQLRDTVSSFDHQPGSIVSINEELGSKNLQLKAALESNASRIIITTLQTFPVLAQTATKLAGNRFAVIADEAHSSQSGEASKDLKLVLGGSSEDELAAAEAFDTENRTSEMTFEDMLQASLEARSGQGNITFFAFTATPTAKTLNIFGSKKIDEQGEVILKPFHLYSMKQAIEEKYILDVLRNYTTYKTYYKLANGLSPDKELPKGKASSALARFASLHPTHLAQKAEIIVEHYRAHTSKKIGGRAKAMVVTRSRLHAVRYKQAIDAYIAEKDYKDVRTLVAFSGKVLDPTNRQVDYTEAGMNEVSSNDIPKEFAKSYQVLIVAEKFQTGFDQPLLHTMYVDKKLRDLKAVQTLSRLNRIHPNKDDTFVLDFENDLEDIQAAFKPYFEETEALASDPNVLFDLQRSLMSAGVVAKDEMRAAVEGILLGGTAGSSMLKANSDPAVGRWRLLEDDDREQFRTDCNNFVKTYAFLGLIVPFQDPDLEELYYFSKFLVRRLIIRKDSQDIDLDGILLTHLKVEMTAQEKDISLNAGLEEPLAGIMSGANPKRQQDPKSLLSELIGVINDKFGVNLTDADRVWFEQQEVHLAGNVEIREVALENDYDNFEMFLRPRIADQVIERNDANMTLFNAFFDKPEFAELMIQAVAKSLYTKFNSA